MVLSSPLTADACWKGDERTFPGNIFSPLNVSSYVRILAIESDVNPLFLNCSCYYHWRFEVQVYGANSVGHVAIRYRLLLGCCKKGQRNARQGEKLAS